MYTEHTRENMRVCSDGSIHGESRRERGTGEQFAEEGEREAVIDIRTRPP